MFSGRNFAEGHGDGSYRNKTLKSEEGTVNRCLRRTSDTLVLVGLKLAAFRLELTRGPAKTVWFLGITIERSLSTIMMSCISRGGRFGERERAYSILVGLLRPLLAGGHLWEVNQ